MAGPVPGRRAFWGAVASLGLLAQAGACAAPDACSRAPPVSARVPVLAAPHPLPARRARRGQGIRARAGPG